MSFSSELKEEISKSEKLSNKEAVKYETKTDFQKNCNVAYRKALQLKIIDDFFTNDYIQY